MTVALSGALLMLLAFEGMLVLLATAPNAAAALGNATPAGDTRADGAHIPAEQAPSSQDKGAGLDDMALRYALTSREREMLGYLASGFSRRRIAEDLSISESTVQTHVNNLYTKLGIHKRDELLDLVEAYRKGKSPA